MINEWGAERGQGSGLGTVYYDGKFGVRREAGEEEVNFFPWQV